MTGMQLQLDDPSAPCRTPGTPEPHISFTLEETDTVAELKLGYKASVEQFTPRELVELGGGG